MHLIAYLYDLSKQDTETYMNENIPAKNFVRLAIDEKAPDHSTLTVFRERLVKRVKMLNKTTEFTKSVDLENLEKEMASLVVFLVGIIFSKILELLDKHIQETIPASWKNIGREMRNLIFEHGYVSFSRRVYRDDKGKRRKPLDELLNIRPYARYSRNVQEIGSAIVADTTFRKGAELMSVLLKTNFSHSSLHRMFRKLGLQVEKQESESQPTEAKVSRPVVLYGESDGVWINLQREKKKRAEVRTAILYTGKKRIGKGRFRCANKVSLTQLGGSTHQWQMKLYELAHKTYDLDQTQMLVVGGDGNAWVKHSFDQLELPKTYLLDRFHVIRTVKQAFGNALNTNKLLRQCFTEGFPAIQMELRDIIRKSNGEQKKIRLKAYTYLAKNQDALIDLDKRDLPKLRYAPLGAMEGNVDKLVRQRMRGRGMSWSISGAKAMLAVLRHKEELAQHSFSYVPIEKKEQKTIRRTMPKKKEEVYQPKSGSLPIFHGPQQSEPWVQLLRSKLAYDLSINSFF